MDIIEDKKFNLCFDARVLNNIDGNSNRSGIYFVAKNILYILSRKNINLYIYLDNSNNIKKIYNSISLDINSFPLLTNKSNFSHINAFFSPINIIPNFINIYPNISQYVIIHDVVPLVFEGYYNRIKNLNTHWYFKLINGLDAYSYCFANSNHTKQDFLKYFPQLNPNNIDVIPLSTNQEYKPNKDINTLLKTKKKYNIPSDKKYLFSLCSLEPRKNLIRAVRTFIDFIEKNNINDIVYVLGGGAWAGFIEKFEKECPKYNEHKDKILKIGYVDDEDLEILYSNAHWFVYTSQYEGFGMPPLEAMKCGCPVITSNNSSLPEVVGDAGIMINYDSDEEHIKAYEDYYYNDALRLEMSKKGIERAKLFSWDKAVDIILNRMLEVEKKKQNKPLVTIITPTYNLIENDRKDYFIQNLESVRYQSYDNIEHIVIDGASNDGTIELLEEYKNKGWITYYSEPDKGIYDALNKGILKANGKYVVCLNSDDYYCNNDAVKLEVMKLEETDADACYANAFVVDKEKGNIINHWKGKESFYPIFGQMPCHQTFMIRVEVMKELGLYSLDDKTSAYMCFYANIIQYNKKIIGLDINIINTVYDDVSEEFCKNKKMGFIFSFSKEYGQYHYLSNLDFEYLFNYNFTRLPFNEAIKLGSKLDKQEWREKYFEKLFNNNHYTYISAISRIQNYLSYKLGRAMIQNSKSIFGILKLPFILMYLPIKHNIAKKEISKLIKLPKIETLPDYKNALKYKNHMSYKLGEAFLKGCKNWYKGGIITFIFDVVKINKRKRDECK